MAQLLPAAISELELLSGRSISASSNQTTIYSTDGNAALVIHDRPYVDPSRIVTLDGTTLTEGTDVWFIQDRRSVNITTTVQLRQFGGQGEWWKGDPGWFDKNLDIWAARWAAGGPPNNLVITGIRGQPIITDDTKIAIMAMTAYLFKSKDAVANTTFTPAGQPLDMNELPAPVQQWLANWRIRTAVMSI